MKYLPYPDDIIISKECRKSLGVGIDDINVGFYSERVFYCYTSSTTYKYLTTLNSVKHVFSFHIMNIVYMYINFILSI